MIAVILLNMGGPDSLESVQGFLYNLFSDRDIIRLGPPFLQKILAYFISKKRAKKSVNYYKLIGGKSPITEITTQQAKKIQEKLKEINLDIPCYVGMRYFHPRTPDVITQLKAQGVKKILALSLYPHYSYATSGSSIKDFINSCKNNKIDFDVIDRFYNVEGYILSLQDKLNEVISKITYDNQTKLVYSAHNLPRYMIENGDPYLMETKETIRLLEEKTKINGELAFQSKSGPVEWLSPTTEEKLLELANLGYKKIIIMPVSFVSDHIETLYEIDIAYKELMQEKGVQLYRTPSLNTHDRFILTLTKLIMEKLEKNGWIK